MKVETDPRIAAALEVGCLFPIHCGRQHNRFTYCSHPGSACVHADPGIVLPLSRATLEGRVTHLERSLRVVMERLSVPSMDDGRIAALRELTNG